MSSIQHRLKIARETRRRISLTYSLMGQGALTLEHVLRKPPPHLKNVCIYDLLVHAPKLGRDGVRKVLREAKVDVLDFVGDLDLEARKRIISKLPPRAR